MSMISSLTWVRRGVPAENPEKIELSEEQIQALIGKAKEANPGINFDEENMEDIQEKAAELNDDSDDSDDDEMDMDNDKNNGEFNDLAEFNMDDYDNEGLARLFICPPFRLFISALNENVKLCVSLH
eukprot:Awhi_evm2s797